MGGARGAILREYEYKVPEPTTDSEVYNISDSEDESEHFKYNEHLFSSESSCDDEDEDYFQRFNRRSASPEFLDCNRNDDEDDLIIPLETEDCDFGKVELDDRGQMVCPMCSIIFKSKIRYVIHKRRHFAIDHFRCPVCLKGFSKLSQCQAHEYKEHQQTQDKGDPNCMKYSFRTRNARKTCNFNEPVEVDEEDLVCIVPSTCLYPYQGPEISSTYQPYHIEVKYGRSERKTHSKIQAKYALECQKRNKIVIAEKLERVEARLKAQKEAKERKLLREQNRSNGGIIVETESSDISYVPKPVAHPARRHNRVLEAFKDSSGPKCYFCSLCGFTSDDKDGIKSHQNDIHPEVPVSELIQFLCIDKSLKVKKREEERPRRGRRGAESRGNVEREKRHRRIEKRKEAKLFRKRKHIYRVWENPKPSKDEFIFALGLRKSNDVLLGARKPQSLITSSLLRKRRRESSPCPLVGKSIRIPLIRLPNSRKKRFYCCQHCEYFGDSEADVRRHRRSDHLTTLRQKNVSEKIEGKEPRHMDRASRKKRKGNQSELRKSSPLNSELHVHLEDISLTMNVKPPVSPLRKQIAGSGPPRKKTKVI